jgi:hypothetical protein
MSRYRYRYRDSPSATVTDRSPLLPNVINHTDRYRILPLVALQALH